MSLIVTLWVTLLMSAAAIAADKCVSPVAICVAPTSKAPASFQPAKVAKELRACACSLIQTKAGEPCPDLSHFILNKSDAELVQKTYHAATHKETWDFPEFFALPYQPRLARLTSAMAFNAVATRLEQSTAADRKQRDSLWQLSSKAQKACSSLVSTFRVPKPDPLVLTRGLTCAFRDVGKLWETPVWERWPGCPCANGHGIVVSGVCLNGYTPEYFGKEPIDQRIPMAFATFARRLAKRVGQDLKLKEVGVTGCAFLRLETGGYVRDLKAGDEFKVEHLSDHSRSTACDIRFFVFTKSDGSELRYDLAPKGAGGGVFPFADALKKDLGEKLRGLSRADADIYFRGAEKKLTSTDSDVFRLGVFIRNSLSDAGFTIFDSTVNVGHDSHFHVEMPID